MLIKPICLYGILILQNDFLENLTIFDPPPKAREFRRPGLLYEKKIFGVQTSIVPGFRGGQILSDFRENRFGELVSHRDKLV